MTPEQKRMAIAEACGWKWFHCPKSGVEIDYWGQLLKLGDQKWPGWISGINPDHPPTD